MTYLWWGLLATSTNVYFLGDLIMNIIILGPKYIWQSKKILFGECILQIMAIVAMANYWSYDDF